MIKLKDIANVKYCFWKFIVKNKLKVVIYVIKQANLLIDFYTQKHLYKNLT
ncbi:hypothetical protein GENT11_15050 [Flavobacterium ammonificans]|uniref:Uncharacterized protein n=1 Tax=Flavobacterium ammonificans TaxID=1751056 RepID=A0ABM7V2R2_9FLAO|nr:hypothetical protein GENT11_15050 [Flavobacterium ammonificans]